jgi:hypothetical protein
MTREAGAKVKPTVAELTIFTKSDGPLSRGGTRCVYGYYQVRS